MKNYNILSKICITAISFIFLFAPSFVGANVLIDFDKLVPFLLLMFGIFIAVSLVAVASYIYFAVCLMFLGRKTQTPHRWMAWVPVLNFLLLCRIARKPNWWVIFVVLPIIFNLFTFYFVSSENVLFVLILSLIQILTSLALIIITIILWVSVAKMRGKPAWWGFLTIIPIVNLVIMGILAFSNKDKLKSEGPLPSSEVG